MSVDTKLNDWTVGTPELEGNYLWREGPGSFEHNVEVFYQQYGTAKDKCVKCFSMTDFSFANDQRGQWRPVKDLAVDRSTSFDPLALLTPVTITVLHRSVRAEFGLVQISESPEPLGKMAIDTDGYGEVRLRLPEGMYRFNAYLKPNLFGSIQIYVPGSEQIDPVTCEITVR